MTKIDRTTAEVKSAFATVNLRELSDALACVLPFADLTGSQRYAMACVRLEIRGDSVSLMATDGRRICRLRLTPTDLVEGGAEILIYPEMVRELIALGRPAGAKTAGAEMAIAGDALTVSAVLGGERQRVVCNNLVGRFPRTSDLFDQSYSTYALVDAAELRAAIEAGWGPKRPTKATRGHSDRGGLFVIRGRKLYIQGRQGAAEMYRGRLDAGASDGPDRAAILDVDYILDLLRAMPKGSRSICLNFDHHARAISLTWCGAEWGSAEAVLMPKSDGDSRDKDALGIPGRTYIEHLETVEATPKPAPVAPRPSPIGRFLLAKARVENRRDAAFRSAPGPVGLRTIADKALRQIARLRAAAGRAGADRRAIMSTSGVALPTPAPARAPQAEPTPVTCAPIGAPTPDSGACVALPDVAAFADFALPPLCGGSEDVDPDAPASGDPAPAVEAPDPVAGANAPDLATVALECATPSACASVSTADVQAALERGNDRLVIVEVDPPTHAPTPDSGASDHPGAFASDDDPRAERVIVINGVAYHLSPRPTTDGTRAYFLQRKAGTGVREYEISETPDGGVHCECPDHIHRRAFLPNDRYCKHLRMGILLGLISDKSRRVDIMTEGHGTVNPMPSLNTSTLLGEPTCPTINLSAQSSIVQSPDSRAIELGTMEASGVASSTDAGSPASLRPTGSATNGSGYRPASSRRPDILTTACPARMAGVRRPTFIASSCWRSSAHAPKVWSRFTRTAIGPIPVSTISAGAPRSATTSTASPSATSISRAAPATARPSSATTTSLRFSGCGPAGYPMARSGESSASKATPSGGSSAEKRGAIASRRSPWKWSVSRRLRPRLLRRNGRSRKPSSSAMPSSPLPQRHREAPTPRAGASTPATSASDPGAGANADDLERAEARAEGLRAELREAEAEVARLRALAGLVDVKGGA